MILNRQQAKDPVGWFRFGSKFFVFFGVFILVLILAFCPLLIDSKKDIVPTIQHFAPFMLMAVSSVLVGLFGARCNRWLSSAKGHRNYRLLLIGSCVVFAVVLFYLSFADRDLAYSAGRLGLILVLFGIAMWNAEHEAYKRFSAESKPQEPED